MITKV